MRRSRPIFAIAAALLGALPVGAYYDFIHYDALGNALPEKFNLLQLPSKTVTFFVSGSGPLAYAGYDSFPSVINQIRKAAQVWNGVATSDLRVAFGGMYSASTQDNSPGGDVVFEQMPPGVLAYSGPTTCEDTAPVASCASQNPQPGNTFIPILRSTMHMSQDLTKIPGPSFSETFFLVSVHEMGHALGLQHTFTSSAMSTIATRHTSLSAPIGADDRAGISLLYPVAGAMANFGSITGRVTYSDDGTPAHMASVVAVPPVGDSVSSLTKADGTFEIDGIPPGQYFLYAHALPPSANVFSPLDSNGNQVEPGRPFNAVLYPASTNAVGATPIGVSAGQVSANYNFSVTPIPAVPIYDVSLYSYFSLDQVNYNAVHPAYVDTVSGPATLAASGVGLGSQGALAEGLTVSSLSGGVSIPQSGLYAYTNAGYTYLALPVVFSIAGDAGRQNLLFETPNYVYLLPGAFEVAASQPPAITGVNANADGTATVLGAGFQSDTRIYFDALPSTVMVRNTNAGLLVVKPPAGASGQTSTLTAYNTDGQNSMFYPQPDPFVYSYGTAPQPQIQISPAQLPAGAEASIEITGTNTNFEQGRSTFGFGTHDVVVRRTFILSPTRAIVDVGMPPAAAQVNVQATALTDFQVAVAPGAFQVTAPQTGLPAAVPILFNAIPGQVGSYSGAVVSLYGSNMETANSQAPTGANPTVTFCGAAASLLYASPTLINLTIPPGLTPGLCTLLVNNGAETSKPVVVNIDPPPAVIVAVQFAANQPVTAKSPAQTGETVHVLLSGFASSGSKIDPSRVTVSTGGVSAAALSVTESATAGTFDVAFMVPNGVTPSAQASLIVYLDGLSSLAGTIAVGTIPGT